MSATSNEVQTWTLKYKYRKWYFTDLRSLLLFYQRIVPLFEDTNTIVHISCLCYELKNVDRKNYSIISFRKEKKYIRKAQPVIVAGQYARVVSPPVYKVGRSFGREDKVQKLFDLEDLIFSWRKDINGVNFTLNFDQHYKIKFTDPSVGTVKQSPLTLKIHEKHVFKQ